MMDGQLNAIRGPIFETENLAGQRTSKAKKANKIYN